MASKFVENVNLSELRNHTVEMAANANLRSVADVLHFYSKVTCLGLPLCTVVFCFGPLTNLDSRFSKMI